MIKILWFSQSSFVFQSTSPGANLTWLMTGLTFASISKGSSSLEVKFETPIDLTFPESRTASKPFQVSILTRSSSDGPWMISKSR